MRSLQSRLSRLETAARRTRSEMVSDEEVISALKRWDWDSGHLNAMFRVVEPGLLGHALLRSANLRRALLAGEEFEEPIAELHQMCFLVAFGSDIVHPLVRELESHRRYLTKPLRNDEKERTSNNGMFSTHEAQAGLVRRLFQKHGLRQLQTTVSDLADASEQQRSEFCRRFVPKVDQTRWNRMVEMVQPLKTHWGHVQLLAYSSDGVNAWYRDGNGQESPLEL